MEEEETAVHARVPKIELRLLSTPVHFWSQDLCPERGSPQQHVIKEHVIVALGTLV